MGRTKGSLNKEPQRVPDTVQMTTEQRLEFLANLIVDHILEDQKQDRQLLKRIEGKHAAEPTHA